MAAMAQKKVELPIKVRWIYIMGMVRH